MAKMNHALLYGNYEAAFQNLTDAQVGRLIRAMLHYLNTEEDQEPKGPEKYLWPVLKDQLARNMEKYEKICERNRTNSTTYWDAKRQDGIDKLKDYPV